MAAPNRQIEPTRTWGWESGSSEPYGRARRQPLTDLTHGTFPPVPSSATAVSPSSG